MTEQTKNHTFLFLSTKMIVVITNKKEDKTNAGNQDDGACEAVQKFDGCGQAVFRC